MSNLKLTDKGILSVIRESLKGILGDSSAWALDFYADPQIALKNPRTYATLVGNVLGGGTERLMTNLIETLYRKVGVEPVAGASLEECIRAIRLRA
jgi:hypothetical protein